MRINRARFSSLLRKIFWQIDIPHTHTAKNSVHVDLGAGNNPRNPFRATKLIATDFHDSFTRHDGVEFRKCDLTRNLPFDSDSVDSFTAFDVLEHIPRWERTKSGIEFPFINLMNEIHRCLKPGGIFMALTPAYPSEAAFQDPTHVNVISQATLLYFTGNEPWAKLLGYGFDNGFTVVTQTWQRGGGVLSETSLISELEKARKSEKFKIILKLAKRIINLVRTRKPTHLLWVLKKES
jgi:SAM-dependent methyltransferase